VETSWNQKISCEGNLESKRYKFESNLESKRLAVETIWNQKDLPWKQAKRNQKD